MGMKIHDISRGRARPRAAVVKIPPQDLEEMEAKAKELGFQEAYLMQAAEIVTAEWVGLKCRYGCANYNTNWCCPPAAPSLERSRHLLAEYELALLLVGQHSNPSFYRNNSAKRRQQVRHWKEAVALERHIFLMGYYKAFCLTGEACGLCPECSYPDNCLFPNEKRPAIEACSIDIFQTIRNLGQRVHLARDVRDCYSHYSLILLK